jgi:hypothetical protein
MVWTSFIASRQVPHRGISGVELSLCLEVGYLGPNGCPQLGGNPDFPPAGGGREVNGSTAHVQRFACRPTLRAIWRDQADGR